MSVPRAEFIAEANAVISCRVPPSMKVHSGRQMAGLSTAGSARAAGIDRPPEDRVFNTARSMASWPIEGVGIRLACTVESRPAGLVQRQARRRRLGGPSGGPAKSRIMVVERADGPSVGRRMVPIV